MLGLSAQLLGVDHPVEPHRLTMFDAGRCRRVLLTAADGHLRRKESCP